MGIDKGIDPYTGEYLPTRINHLGNAVYIRLATPLGSWWADTTIGSRLHELAREKDLPRVGLLAEQYAEQALRPLIEDGRARSITVTSQQPHDGRCLLLITVEDATGREQTFQHPVKVS
ncbi:MAG: phage GP46 family protein [Desulfovibrio sp.]|nr:phage GP46 family protein [Desulfovibrio sp.]MBI4960422.1 phage GP46 family protein [Desulfovibrio sp.]